MSYAISFKRSAAKALEALDVAFRAPTAVAIQALADEPRPDGCKKMKGDFAGHYRIKVRHQIAVIYRVDDGALTVLVVTVDKRGDAY